MCEQNLLPLAPPPVQNLMVGRLSGSEASVTWTVPSLQQARGFVTYIIKSLPTKSGIMGNYEKLTCGISPCSVSVEVGGVTLTGLNPGLSYDIVVIPINEDETKGERTLSTVLCECVMWQRVTPLRENALPLPLPSPHIHIVLLALVYMCIRNYYLYG